MVSSLLRRLHSKVGPYYKSQMFPDLLIFSFPGSAVHIYGIDLVNPANISFSMDHPASMTSFHHNSAPVDYVYDSLFFSASGLDSTAQHTVTWTLENSSTGGLSGVFDYAVVTVDQALEASGTVSSTGS